MKVSGKKILYVIGGLLAVSVLAAVAWMVVDTGIEATAHAAFCGTCHVMQPMVAAYHDSVHGGNNPYGVAAQCSDCHVNHSNAFAYLVSKSESGIHDTWIALVMDEFTLDWQANRERRAEYVYDSGCLQCHTNLQSIAAGHDAHAKYFDGLIDAKCVDCHPGVGHENLNKYLLISKYR
ncbi:MAG TPA: cytochrome C [Chloroflexi bacterium]|nr:cytochrome C [Chloroflexota bacterium]